MTKPKHLHIRVATEDLERWKRASRRFGKNGLTDWVTINLNQLCRSVEVIRERVAKVKNSQSST